MRLAVLTAATLLAACGGDEKTTTIPTEDGTMKVTQSTSSPETTRIEATGPDGQVSTMTAGPTSIWPATAPSYAAAFPGAKVISTMGGSDGEGSGTMVMYETTAMSPEQVVAFYKARAQAAKLGNVSQMGAGGNFMFGAEDEATGRSMSVQASAADGKTSGMVTFAQKQPKG